MIMSGAVEAFLKEHYDDSDWAEVERRVKLGNKEIFEAKVATRSAWKNVTLSIELHEED